MIGTTVSFAIAESLQRLYARWRFRGEEPIVVVHQMARVGSKSIGLAIRDVLPGVRRFHTYYLNPSTIELMRGKFLRRHRSTGSPGLHREYLHARWLSGRIRSRSYGDWKVISLVRDPVARTVSAFLRHLPLNHPELGERFRDDPDHVPELIELFRDPNQFEHAFALEWFDREVRDVLGVDVFDRPYPSDGLGLVYSCDAGELLVLRTEDLAFHGGEIVGAFLGIEPLALKRRNRSVDLSYGATYRRFVRELRLSSDYLDRMYGSRLARHFYSEAELRAFRERWVVDA